MPMASPLAGTDRHGSTWEVLLVFLRLGLTSFGGPIAHSATSATSSSRAVNGSMKSPMPILLPSRSFSRAGEQQGWDCDWTHARGLLEGALAAWVGFTLPSASALVLFAYGVSTVGDALGGGWLHGLKVVAVAVVAQAVLGMMRTLAPDRERATMAVVAAAIVLAFPSAWGQVGAILLGGLAGYLLLPATASANHVTLPRVVRRPVAIAAIVLFFAILFGLPLWVAALPNHSLQLFEAFYRAGSLVSGGGHVVLPLLQASVVPPGWVTNDAFLAGYGAAQAVPGPLFTFSAYLGAVMGPAPNGLVGAALCLVAMFLPVSVDHRPAAVLGRAESPLVGAISAPRRECSRRRTPACRALQSGLDGGNHQFGRLRARHRGFPVAVDVADAALACGDHLCAEWSSDRSALDPSSSKMGLRSGRSQSPWWVKRDPVA